MAETDIHRENMIDLIETLKGHFAEDPMVYVSGNLLMYYEEGDRRKHLAPDVFVVSGVPKRLRENYLIWDEGKGPDVVIELTSKSTRNADEDKKFKLYRDVLKVSEYFLFDPFEDYLKPSMKGYRLRRKQYAPIAPVLGRLPSTNLGLHLERNGPELRLFDPVSGLRLLTPSERATQAEAAFRQAETARLLAEANRKLAEVENDRLKREIEELRRQQSPPKG